MNDQDLLDRIAALIAEEHEIEQRAVASAEPPDAGRLSQIEVALDQCWDLLRRRRARKEFGLGTDDMTTRPPSEVEGYLQ